MGTKATVVTLGLLTAAGYAIAENWDAISKAIGLEEVSPEYGRALDLAKSDYNLDRYRTNYDMIDSRIASSKGKAEMIGWSADRKTDNLFLVTCAFIDEDGKKDGYWFEVDVAKREVHMVRGDPVLEKRYGVPPAPR